MPWLRSLARRLASDDADDLVQETWLSAHDSPPQQRHSLRPWLGRVLRNNHRMARRSAGARVSREARTAPGAAAPDPESLVASKELYELLDRLLEELDDEEQHLVRQRYFAERSAVELGDELGLPAATVRTKLRRALHKLRSRLDERCGGRRSWAVVASAPSLLPGAGVIVMKVALSVSLAAAVAGLALWFAVGRDDAESSAPTTKPKTAAAAGPVAPKAAPGNANAKPTPSAAEPGNERTADHRRMRARVREALEVRDHAEKPAVATYEVPAVNMSVAVGQSIVGCKDLLEDETEGRVSFSVHYLGAPDVGAIVDEVTIDADTLGNPEFTNCVLASAELAQLDAPDKPLHGTFKGHYTLGKPPNNLLAFVQANPGVAEKFPIFEQLLVPDATVTPDMLATGLAETIDQNPELAKQFESWIVEDGLEVSHLKE